MHRIAKQKPHIPEGKQLTPAVVYFWAIGLAFVFYLLARFGLAAFPHPVHWLSMGFGALIGYFWGWVWYRWRGDVF